MLDGFHSLWTIRPLVSVLFRQFNRSFTRLFLVFSLLFRNFADKSTKKLIYLPFVFHSWPLLQINSNDGECENDNEKKEIHQNHTDCVHTPDCFRWIYLNFSVLPVLILFVADTYLARHKWICQWLVLILITPKAWKFGTHTSHNIKC